MPRWKNNLEQNCNEVMDNIIKNISPGIRQDLVLQVLNGNIANNKKEIEKFLRASLDIPASLSKHTKGYWIARGWSVDEAYVKAKEHQLPNRKGGFSQRCWLEKINPITGVNYTAAEADFERNSRRPIRKEYWIKQGYAEEDAIWLAVAAKTSNNNKGASSSANSSVRRVSSTRCIDYYTARGYNTVQAIQFVSNNQKLFSKEICIEKHGELEGLKIWQRRQDVWQATLNQKSTKEKARINKLKLFKGGSVSKGESKLFEEICIQGISCDKQYAILKNATQHYVYDIVYKNKIIEYNGDYWHASPKKYKESDIIKFPNNLATAKDIWDKDKEKIKFAEMQGYQVLVVWESDFNQNKKEIINQCIQFLTQ